MRTWIGLAIAACLTLGALPAAAQNLVVNGSFEAGPPVGDYAQYDPGDRALTGWTISRGNIEVIGSYFPCADGKRCLDLNGRYASGVVSQVVRVSAGSQYDVTFSLAGNPHCGEPVKRLQVAAAGQSASFTHARGLEWTTRTWRFTADHDSATLAFTSQEPGDSSCGPMLDKVSVVPADLASVAAGSLQPCAPISGAVATLSPCAGPPGTTINVRLERNLGPSLGATPGAMLFQTLPANGAEAHVLVPIQGSANTAGAMWSARVSARLCAEGSPVWNVSLVNLDDQNLGVIGQFQAGPCPR